MEEYFAIKNLHTSESLMNLINAEEMKLTFVIYV